MLIDEIVQKAEKYNKLIESGEARWVECPACKGTHLKVVAK